MSNEQLRIFIAIGALILISLGAVQLYWFRKALIMRDDAFNRDVSQALFKVSQDYYNYTDVVSPSLNPVNQLTSNYFVVMLNGEIDANFLEKLLVTEFQARNVIADFEYGVYHCESEQMVYGNYVHMTKGKTRAKTVLPVWKDHNYYFGVNFPTKTLTLVSSLPIFVFSSIVLVLVFIIYAFTLVVILRQKRFSEIQSDFINNMTHEFKTPLAGIQLASEALLEKGITSDQHQKYVSLIQKENKHLLHQIETILQSESVTDPDSASSELIDLNVLLKELSGLFEVTLSQMDGSMQLKLTPDKPIIQANPEEIRNVFINLLDNAIKYGGNPPIVQIGTMVLKEHVHIHIEDNGEGIDEQHRKMIFRKFYRVPQGNVHNAKGFGLGLYYVQKVIRKHGGKIDVHCSKLGGCKVEIIMPYAG